MSPEPRPSTAGVEQPPGIVPAPAVRLIPRVKLWVETGAGYGFGPGLIAILLAVEHAGSIKHAARTLGRSYRHVWDRIKEAESALGTPLVTTQVGGRDPRRSGLTDAARRLVAEFVALHERMLEVIDEESGRRFGPGLLAGPPAGSETAGD